MTQQITPQDFVHKWDKAQLREKASAQEHFIDLCHLIDHGTPRRARPEGVVVYL